MVRFGMKDEGRRTEGGGRSNLKGEIMRKPSFLFLILAISAGTLAAQSAEQVATDITYLASDAAVMAGVTL